MFAQTDPGGRTAIDAMPKAEALVDKPRKIAVQRMR